MNSQWILIIFLFVHELKNQLLSHVPSETATFFSSKIAFVQKLSFAYETQWILTIPAFTKIHLRKVHFFFALRISLFDRAALKLSYVCGGFNIFFFGFFLSLIYQPPAEPHIK